MNTFVCVVNRHVGLKTCADTLNNINNYRLNNNKKKDDKHNGASDELDTALTAGIDETARKRRTPKIARPIRTTADDDEWALLDSYYSSKKPVSKSSC
jgi:hypothetical protein